MDKHLVFITVSNQDTHRSRWPADTRFHKLFLDNMRIGTPLHCIQIEYQTVGLGNGGQLGQRSLAARPALLKSTIPS
jgi:hypothetical protein